VCVCVCVCVCDSVCTARMPVRAQCVCARARVLRACRLTCCHGAILTRTACRRHAPRASPVVAALSVPGKNPKSPHSAHDFFKRKTSELKILHDRHLSRRSRPLANVADWPRYSLAPAGREDCYEEAAMALEARSIVGVLSQDSDRAVPKELIDCVCMMANTAHN
jgi:hypothetical protein